jgi:F420H(2)-dependent quinone reductase
MPKIPFDINVRLYRLIGGGKMASSTLLLYTTSRETGEKHTVQIAYVPDGSSYLVVPKGNEDKMPGWYQDLKAEPSVEVQIGKRMVPARAQEVSPDERSTVWERVTKVHSDYEGAQKKSAIPLPIVRLTPL